MKFSRPKIIGCCVAVVVICLVTWGVVWRSRPTASSISIEPPTTQVIDDRSIPTPPPELIIPDPSPYEPKPVDSNHLSVLLLGYGGAGHEGGFLSDVILLVYVDIPQKKIAFIHIPRDSWISLTLGSTAIQTKVNGALAMGTKSGNYPQQDLPKDSILRGSYLSKMAVKTITGLDVDYVIGIDFNSFIQAINSLQGIEVDVPQTFDDPWYPIKGRELELCGKTPEEVTALSATMSGFTLEKQFPCRYEHLHFNTGSNHMDGETALKFARSRHSNTYGGDFARGERQTAVINGIKQRLITLKALDRIPVFFQSLSKLVKTDISIDVVNQMAPVLKQLSAYKKVEIGLSTANVLVNGKSDSGAYILIPKAGLNQWSDTHTYIQSVIQK